MILNKSPQEAMIKDSVLEGILSERLKKGKTPTDAVTVRRWVCGPEEPRCLEQTGYWSWLKSANARR